MLRFRRKTTVDEEFRKADNRAGPSYAALQSINDAPLNVCPHVHLVASCCRLQVVALKLNANEDGFCLMNEFLFQNKQ